jgi:hypothetical protein
MQDGSDSADSDDGRVLKQSLQIYEKSQWLKATFNKETKRFFRVPKGISALHRELKERFPVLQILVEHQIRPQVIEMTWRGKLIENTSDLQSVARHCQINN